MRIYNVDGTYTEDPNDTDFGWNFSDIVIDETKPNYKDRNKEYRNLERVTKSITEPNLSNSSDSDYEFEVEKPIVIYDCTPQVFSYTSNSNIGLEGSGIINNYIKFDDVNSKIPSKEELMNLIDPCNVESKMLLAVISFAKYKSLKNDEVFKSKSINQKTRNFKFILNNEPIKNYENELYKEIENYHASKEDSMMSLMMELVLNDIDCKISDVTEKNCEYNTSDLGNSIHSNCSSKSNSLDEQTNFEVRSHYLNDPSSCLNIPNRDEVLSSLGLSDEDRSIQSFCEETRDMHLQLRDVKQCFKSETNRVAEILQEASSMEKNLKETIYLSNLLHLLNGDIEKVKLKSSPFKILIDPKHIFDELNLIV